MSLFNAIAINFSVLMAINFAYLPAQNEKKLGSERSKMVEEQIVSRGVSAPRVIDAMHAVPRHRFVPESHRRYSYGDYPLPIGHEQTISQPYIVALMTELLEVDSGSIVLEVGTGSGYQAAVLSEIVREVYSIEIVEPLAERSTAILDSLGYENVHVKAGDGFKGWPEHAPFDAIIVTCAPPQIPQPLLDQLAEGGRLVIPVGEDRQELKRVLRKDGKIVEESGIAVRFVPMTGPAIDSVARGK